MKAIIPVAGIGSRLRPHTHTQPKSLIPVAGKPILGHILDQLIQAGIEEMVFVIGYFWAWVETKAMANPFIEQSFHYKDMARMLAYGSIMYSFYFIASFPIYYFLDEDRSRPWSLWYTFMASCTAGLLTLLSGVTVSRCVFTES